MCLLRGNKIVQIRKRQRIELSNSDLASLHGSFDVYLFTTTQYFLLGNI